MQSLKLPSWATIGAVFVLDGTLYEIVATGVTNRGGTYRHYVVATERGRQSWSLPSAPTTKSALLDSLSEAMKLPRFGPEALEAAIHL